MKNKFLLKFIAILICAISLTAIPAFKFFDFSKSAIAANNRRIIAAKINGNNVNVRSQPTKGKVLYQVSQSKDDRLIVDSIPINDEGEDWYRVLYKHENDGGDSWYEKANGYIIGYLIELEPLRDYELAMLSDYEPELQQRAQGQKQQSSEMMYFYCRRCGRQMMVPSPLLLPSGNNACTANGVHGAHDWNRLQ